MKNIFCLMAIILTLSNCNQPIASVSNDEMQTQTPVDPRNIFTLSDAEKILGEPAHLKDSSSAIGNVSKYNSVYTADSTDRQTGKTGNIYFMFEEYAQVSAAKETYSSIKKANEDHEGIEELHGIGDEAYFHTDKENFYFILVRKGDKMFRMKVNKITGKTSLNEFNNVAKKIANGL